MPSPSKLRAQFVVETGTYHTPRAVHHRVHGGIVHVALVRSTVI